ncbi:MAG TPA: hypothetical protein DD738_13340 [Ruminiclostridium sp.]|nr:hypothetical protein [Ruminiclostridium sp.]
MYDYKGVVMITLDASNVTPLYIQLADLIKSSIQQGKIGYGEQIPTEFQLSEQYTVSRNTVRRAIRVLEKENLLEKRQGKGTFVKSPFFVELNSPVGSFTEAVEKSSSVASTQVIALKTIKCPGDIAKELNISGNDDVIFLSRLRKVDGIPAIMEEDFFPLSFEFLLGMDLNNQSIFRILNQQLGIKMENSKMILEAIPANEDHRNILKVNVNSPVLVIKQTLYSKSLPVYYNIQYIHSDVYKSSVYTTFPIND